MPRWGKALRSLRLSRDVAVISTSYFTNDWLLSCKSWDYLYEILLCRRKRISLFLSKVLTIINIQWSNFRAHPQRLQRVASVAWDKLLCRNGSAARNFKKNIAPWFLSKVATPNNDAPWWGFVSIRAEIVKGFGHRKSTLVQLPGLLQSYDLWFDSISHFFEIQFIKIIFKYELPANLTHGESTRRDREEKRRAYSNGGKESELIVESR